jgi:hypothetical protein
MTINFFIAALTWAGVSLLLFVNTFIFYLAVMKLREAKKQGLLECVHVSVHSLGYTILFIGLVLDTLLNWVLLTITLWEFPQEFLSTTRIVRHKFRSQGWRQRQAVWWCKNWLTPFDDLHCERRKRTRPITQKNRRKINQEFTATVYSKINTNSSS